MKKAEYEAKKVFRGKSHLTGEWVYGYLLYVEDGFAFIIPEVTDKSLNVSTIGEAVLSENQIMCEAETLSEWTGVKDCKGDRIFEGDLISMTYEPLHPNSKPIKVTIPYYFEPCYQELVRNCKQWFFKPEISGNIFEKEKEDNQC